MSLHAFVLITIFLVQNSASDYSCNTNYTQMYSEHTMCKPPNPDCSIIAKGLSQEDKDLILQLHNEFRNNIAIGKETKAGGMPKAADMLEMTWDEELAAVAQKHAESCMTDHDCNECRVLKHFAVGQNLGMKTLPPSTTEKLNDWNWFANELYAEVLNFNKNGISSYVDGGSDEKTQFGHFTQIIWSKSWRIGCGWVLYKNGFNKNNLYVCNYGPAGNVQDMKIYEEGETCSACPKNTCCGKACQKFNITPKYEGLCHIIDETQPPAGFGPFESDDIFYCDFNGQPDCKRTTTGKNDWELVKTISGNWIHIELRECESVNIMMNNPIKNHNGSFCLKILLRTGAKVHGQATDFNGVVTFLAKDGNALNMTIHSSPDGLNFLEYKMNVAMPKGTITFQLSFSVACNKPSQFIDIKEISVKGHDCLWNTWMEERSSSMPLVNNLLL